MKANKEIPEHSADPLLVNQELHHHLEWLSGILESTRDMIVALDTSFRFVAFNSAYNKEFSSLFGKGIEAGMRLEDAFSQSQGDYEETFLRWKKALEGEEFTCAWDFVNKDLEQKHYELSYSCIRDRKGDIMGATLFGKDITEKIVARQEVKNIQEFVLLANSMPEIVWTSWLDGKNDFINTRAIEYSGLKKEELMQFGWKKFIHPEDVNQCLAKLDEFRGSGKPFEMEYRLLRKDGNYRWFLSRAVPLKVAEGEVVKYLGTAVDIHDQKQLVGELEQKAKELLQISEAIPQMVWTTEPDGKHTFFNCRWYEFTGFSKRQSFNDGWANALHPEDYKRTINSWQHSLDTGDPFKIEYRFRRHDGAFRWFMGQAVPLKDQEGNIIRWFGTLTDIHDQKLQRDELDSKNQKLFQINRYLDEFVHAIAHDLRSPVAGLKLSFDLLDQVEESKKEKIMNGCRTYLDRLDNTLKGLVQLIEVQEDVSLVRYEDLDLYQEVEGVVKDLKEKLMDAGAVIRYGRFDWRTIHYPRPYLYNILRNILRYALRFRDPDRQLNFIISSFLDEKGLMVIRVQENGPGINLEKEMKNLFKPFSHINKGSDRQGMGLAIVKHMVEKNGGRIEVSSILGEGTAFDIYLKEYSNRLI